MLTLGIPASILVNCMEYNMGIEAQTVSTNV